MDTHAFDDGGPAFATSRSSASAGLGHPGPRGMTLRDHFAGLALRALCSTLDPYTRTAIDVDAADAIAQTAYRLADAMINARNGG